MTSDSLLRRQYDEMVSENASLTAQLAASETARAAAEQQLAEARAVLRWYATPAVYECDDPKHDHCTGEIDEDQGARARTLVDPAATTTTGADDRG